MRVPTGQVCCVACWAHRSYSTCRSRQATSSPDGDVVAPHRQLLHRERPSHTHPSRQIRVKHRRLVAATVFVARLIINENLSCKAAKNDRTYLELPLACGAADEDHTAAGAAVDPVVILAHRQPAVVTEREELRAAVLLGQRRRTIRLLRIEDERSDPKARAWRNALTPRVGGREKVQTLPSAVRGKNGWAYHCALSGAADERLVRVVVEVTVSPSSDTFRISSQTVPPWLCRQVIVMSAGRWTTSHSQGSMTALQAPPSSALVYVRGPPSTVEAHAQHQLGSPLCPLRPADPFSDCCCLQLLLHPVPRKPPTSATSSPRSRRSNANSSSLVAN